MQRFAQPLKYNIGYITHLHEEEEEEFIKPQHKNITLRRLRQ